MEMIQAGDSDHKKAFDKMTQLSKEDQQKWYADFMNNFGARRRLNYFRAKVTLTV